MFTIYCNKEKTSTVILGKDNKEIGTLIVRKEYETNLEWDDSFTLFKNMMWLDSWLDLSWHEKSPAKFNFSPNQNLAILWTEAFDSSGDFQPIYDGYLFGSMSTLASAMKEIYDEKENFKTVSLRLELADKKIVLFDFNQ